MKAIIWAPSGCLLAPAVVCAQAPGGARGPGTGQPSALPSKTQLAAQARRALLELASMKSSGRLLPSDEEAKLEALLLKAAILTADLEKPQIEDGKLPELANEVNDLRAEVRAPKALMR